MTFIRPVTTKHRAIFISDVHLGTWGCQAELLLDFLSKNEADTLYLVGDIVDCWRLRRSWYWPASHDEVLEAVLAHARRGCKVIYVPGNHDEALRKFFGTHFSGVKVVPEALHETADGRCFLVLHGDEFDGLVNHARWLSHLGDSAYVALLRANALFNRARRRLGFRYWSLSSYLKLKVKNALRFIDNFEIAVSEVARKRNVDGVICGHIHHAEIRRFGDVTYINDGDWVESCTALVESADGELEIIYWHHVRDGEARETRRLTTGGKVEVAA